MTSIRQVASAHAVAFSHIAEEPLLEDLSLTLHYGRKVALTGPNGGGKSTLLRLLAGELETLGGELHVTPARLFVKQHVLENEGEGLDRLSGGQARMKKLREAFAQDLELLLLDEATNDLDEENREIFRSGMKNFEGALVVASHDPLILDAVDEIWEMKHGRLVRHPPGFEAYVARLEEEERQKLEELRALENRKKKSEREAREVAEGQRRRMQRGQKKADQGGLPAIVVGGKKRQAQLTLAKLEGVHENKVAKLGGEVGELKRSLRNTSEFRWDDTGVEAAPSGKCVVRVEQWSLKDAARSLAPVSFEIHGARRLRLRGANGAGKTTLLRALAGDLEARSRSRGFAEAKVDFALFDQRLEIADPDKKLFEHFQEISKLEMSAARRRLGRVGFEQEIQEKALVSLSGGERVRLHLQALLAQTPSPKLLLLDEPTNHLDLESRLILVEFVKSFSGAILLVSHDERFARDCGIEEEVRLL